MAVWAAWSSLDWKHSGCTECAGCSARSSRSRSSTPRTVPRRPRSRTGPSIPPGSFVSRSEQEAPGPFSLGLRAGSVERRSEIERRAPEVRVATLVRAHAVAGRIDAVEQVVVLEAPTELEGADVRLEAAAEGQGVDPLIRNARRRSAAQPGEPVAAAHVRSELARQDVQAHVSVAFIRLQRAGQAALAEAFADVVLRAEVPQLEAQHRRGQQPQA